MIAQSWLHKCNYNVENAITETLESQPEPSIVSLKSRVGEMYFRFWSNILEI
jgi:hypothetical protein